MSALTSTSDFFEAKYRETPDPWDFATSTYELRRYDTTVAALGDRRFRYAVEPGCSVGVLTQRLAVRCDHVEAFDFSASAAESAKVRCAQLSNVRVTCAALSEQTATKDADLLVLSEIGYYFTEDEWMRVAAALVSGLPTGSTVVATHWLGYSPDHRLSGDQVHSVLAALPRLEMQMDRRFEDESAMQQSFRLNKWVCR